MPCDLAAIGTALDAWANAAIYLAVNRRDEEEVIAGTWDASSLVNAASLESYFSPVRTTGAPDAVRKEHDDGAPLGEEVTPKISGRRTFTWELKCTSDSQHLGERGVDLLDSLPALMAGPTFRTVCRGVRIGFTAVEGPVDVSAEIAGRKRAIGLLTTTFSVAVDQADAPYGYVETFIVTSDIKNQGGTSLPEEAQIHEESIP